MPRGGRRPGAGRKPKPKSVIELARILQHPSSVPTTNAPLPPVEEFDAPNDLTTDERLVWLKQAPHAFQNRTLTRATSLAFERYCKVCVMERNEAKSTAAGGANHRGMLKQINLYELQFLLSPNGRPMPEPPDATKAAPQSALSKFR
jgi:hypothetical protein